jgi:carbon monoxide dehydrogenase subunit G
VQRRQHRREGSLHLLGGASWQVIDATPEVVWRALLDTQHYHRMMPQVLEARLIGAQHNERTVYMRQGTDLLEAAYYLKVKVHEQQRDITFRIDDQRPHDLKAAWGCYTVRPYGHRTLLAYGVMADIGGGLIASLMRDSVHEWMLKTPWMIKRFVEGSGRHIYR